MHFNWREGGQHPVTVVVLIEASVTLTLEGQLDGFSVSSIESDVSAEGGDKVTVGIAGAGA